MWARCWEDHGLAGLVLQQPVCKWPRGCSSCAFGLCPVNEENKLRGTAALRERRELVPGSRAQAGMRTGRTGWSQVKLGRNFQWV